jgi:hypothetical protein
MDPMHTPIRTRLSACTLMTKAGGPTAPPGGPTACPTRDSTTPFGSLTAPPEGLTARVADVGSPTSCVAEAEGLTAPSSGPPAHPMAPTSSPVPCAATTTLASPSVPRAALMTLTSTSALRATPTTHLFASLVAPVSPPTAQPVPRMLPVGAVPVSLMLHPHPMQTRWTANVQHPKLYIAATPSPIPKSVRASLAYPH